MNQQIIEKWKQNRVRTDLLAEEEFIELKTFAKADLLFWFGESYEWQKTPCCPVSRSDTVVYRLRPDYQLLTEPKIVKCEVKICIERLFFTRNATNVALSQAVDFSSFSHLKCNCCGEIDISKVATHIRAGCQVYVVFAENDNA